MKPNVVSEGVKLTLEGADVEEKLGPGESCSGAPITLGGVEEPWCEGEKLDVEEEIVVLLRASCLAPDCLLTG